MSKSRDIADSAATINFIDTVTSNVQDQIDNIDALPSQTGNAGKFLTTDGTTDSWGEVSASPTLEAVASGTLANGETVIINADGTVTAAGLVSTPVPVIGSTVEFEAGSTSDISATYDASANKVIIAYRDNGDGLNGKAVVGTVANGAMTFGTPVIFDSSTSYWIDVAYDSNANKVVVVYRDEGNGSAGTAIVGTVSGTSISFGSAVVYESGSGDRNNVVFDSSANKVIIAWHNSSNYKVTVGTISGTSISFGAVASTSSPSANNAGLVYDANANKTLLCYRGPSNYGYAAVISVSGTTASIGTPAVFISESVSDVNAVYDSSNNKTLIVWRKAANNYGAGIVATISGTSVTFGTEAVLVSEPSYAFGVSFDTTVNKSIVAYYNNTSGYSKSVQGTISGTGVTFTSPVIFLNANVSGTTSLVYDPDSERTIFAFSDGGNSNAGTSLLYSSTTIATNLTSENYIGISDAAYSNGATATIQLVGTVDDAQSGLTAGQSYFVQDNGSIALTPATTPVFAGTAVSATKLLIGERNELPYQTGNSGKFLTTNGTAASWGTPAGGAFTFISTTNLNGTSVVELRNLPVGTYDNFYILITGFGTSAADQNLYARMYSNDSLSTSGNYLAGARLQGGGSSLSYQSQYTSSWNVNKQGTGGYTGGKATLQLWLTNMNDTEPRNFNGYSQFYQGYGANPGNSSMNEQSTNLICGNSESGSFDGIRFYINSGTFVGGQAHVYGFKTS